MHVGSCCSLLLAQLLERVLNSCNTTVTGFAFLVSRVCLSCGVRGRTLILSRFSTFLRSYFPLKVQILSLYQISLLSFVSLAIWMWFGSDWLALLGILQLATLSALVELIYSRCQYIQSLYVLVCLLLILNLNLGSSRALLQGRVQELDHRDLFRLFGTFALLLWLPLIDTPAALSLCCAVVGHRPPKTSLLLFHLFHWLRGSWLFLQSWLPLLPLLLRMRWLWHCVATLTALSETKSHLLVQISGFGWWSTSFLLLLFELSNVALLKAFHLISDSLSHNYMGSVYSPSNDLLMAHLIFPLKKFPIIIVALHLEERSDSLRSTIVRDISSEVVPVDNRAQVLRLLELLINLD